MENIADKIMDWNCIEDATLYFKGQDAVELTFVNKFESRSLDFLQKKLNISDESLVVIINEKLKTG